MVVLAGLRSNRLYSAYVHSFFVLHLSFYTTKGIVFMLTFFSFIHIFYFEIIMDLRGIAELMQRGPLFGTFTQFLPIEMCNPSTMSEQETDSIIHISPVACVHVCGSVPFYCV